jgi:LPXTG-motif cell wall-anchored protein
MSSSTAGGAAFIVVGVVFIAIGSSGQRAFIAIGAAFVLIGFIFIARRRRVGGLK